MRSALVSLLMALAAGPCWAGQISIETGGPSDTGQVIIPFVGPGRMGVQKQPTGLDITVPGAEETQAPDRVPRNVVSVTGGKGVVKVMIVPGTYAKWKHHGKTLVVTVIDPKKRDAALADGSRPNPGKPVDTPPPIDAAVPPAPAPTSSALSQTNASQTTPSQTTPSQPTPSQAEQAEAPAAPGPASPPHPVARSFTVVAGTETGVAAFRLGQFGAVVFDESVSLSDGDEDGSGLALTVQPTARGSFMTVPLAEDEALVVSRSNRTLTVTVGAATGSPADMAAVPNGIQIKIGNPGRVMAVSDPVSGQTLLIGTTRQVSAEHAAVGLGRSAPGYTLLPTWLGVALQTSSDQIDLKVSMAGYAVTVADKASRNAVAPARQNNQFAIPNEPQPVLEQQLKAQVASAASAPARGRGPDRVAAARTMLALGLSVEAAATLALAANDDPAVARDPVTAALAGIAAVLAARPDDAGGLDNPALPTGGDIALWRGLRDAAQGRPAPALAGAWPLLSAYPEAVRQRIAPAVMEAAAREGADIPAADIAGPSFALARALKLAHDGPADAAVAALGEVRDSRDERASVLATVALADLLLRSGQLGPAEAADRLARQTVRWRGDALELSLQLRVAQLRAEAFQWRAALGGLRDTGIVFANKKAEIAAAQAGVFQALVATDPAKVSPMETVLIATDFADVLPGGEEGDRLAVLLADKLAALDLPARAAPVLESLFSKSDSPVAKAEYGFRLAQMRYDAGDAAAAEALLSRLDMSGSPDARRAQRSTLLAQAEAAQGHYGDAAATLLDVPGLAADELRASYHARAGDWQRSLEVLDGIVSATIQDGGELTEQQQDLILRTATAAVQAGDAEALKRLGRFDRRLAPPRADLFRVLTATAIRGPEDLPRAGRELAASKTLPDRFSALRAR